MYNVTHDDYTFVERQDQTNWVVRLKTGKWKDTFYSYDRVQIHPPEDGWPEEEDGVGVLKFTYGLIESPLDLEELSTDNEFNDYIGGVLRHILEDSFDSGKYSIGGKDEDGEH
mgnify:CR=1 FL=1